ncbi:signal recognition particle, SRP9/SRP14 subunit [Dipodascopsis tothii]|uniref:signal recognition particle, SRP9/SRP14 subunit n=1 Tax=Dipodascopsis tothii TaxID=44089 RepID=UPI0034CED3AA
MDKNRVSNEQFLAKVEELFKQQSEQGSVFLQQKRLTPHDDVERSTGTANLDDQLPAAQSATYSVLFRVTDGSRDKATKKKYTTVVAPADLDEYWKKYSEAVKAGLIGLKKKEKKKAPGKKKKAGKAKKK